jgi:hypothetical protein
LFKNENVHFLINVHVLTLTHDIYNSYLVSKYYYENELLATFGVIALIFESQFHFIEVFEIKSHFVGIIMLVGSLILVFVALGMRFETLFS